MRFPYWIRKKFDDFHADCICQMEEAAFYEDGKLQYVFLDGVKFVPETQ